MAETQTDNGSDPESMTINIGGETVEMNPASMLMLNEIRQLTKRLDFGNRAGLQFEGDRDIYEELGYKKQDNIEFEDYASKYERQHIAGRIVDLPAEATWRNFPSVVPDTDDDDVQGSDATSFESVFDDIVEDVKLWHNFERVDRIAGVGQFGLLFLGFDDVEDPEELQNPVLEEEEKERFRDENSLDRMAELDINLQFVSPYSQKDATIETFFDDISDPRFNTPKTYKLDMSGKRGESTIQVGSRDFNLTDVEVHADRIIHIAEDALFDENHGRPRLKRLYNILDNLEKVIGPWAESFWKEIAPDFAFNIDPDAKFKQEDVSDFEDEIQTFVHKLQRYFVKQGVDVKRLTADINDMTDGVEILFKIISGTTGIPLRKFFGSERGELASTQDERAWAAKIDSRRDWYAEPMILNPTIQRFQMFGILPNIPFTFEWPALFTLNEMEKAEIAKDRAEAASKFEQAAVSGITIDPAEARVLQNLPAARPGEELDEEFREMEDLEMIEELGI